MVLSYLSYTRYSHINNVWNRWLLSSFGRLLSIIIILTNYGRQVYCQFIESNTTTFCLNLYCFFLLFYFLFYYSLQTFRPSPFKEIFLLLMMISQWLIKLWTPAGTKKLLLKNLTPSLKVHTLSYSRTNFCHVAGIRTHDFLFFFSLELSVCHVNHHNTSKLNHYL